MQDEDIWVDEEALDERAGERKKRRKLRDVLFRMKEKGAVAMEAKTGELLTPEQITEKAKAAAEEGKVLEVRTVPPVRGG